MLSDTGLSGAKYGLSTVQGDERKVSIGNRFVYREMPLAPNTSSSWLGRGYSGLYTCACASFVTYEYVPETASKTLQESDGKDWGPRSFISFIASSFGPRSVATNIHSSLQRPQLIPDETAGPANKRRCADGRPNGSSFDVGSKRDGHQCCSNDSFRCGRLTAPRFDLLLRRCGGTESQTPQLPLD